MLNEQIQWRPNLVAIKGDQEFAVDIRLNSNTPDFWIATYKKAYSICPNIKIFIAFPEDIVLPFVVGKKLEDNNIGLIIISYDRANILFEPHTATERITTKAIRKELDARIEKATYEDLEPYVKEITDAVNIFEIGCPRESIGAIGRVLETTIRDYLIEANRKHKIALSESRRGGMSFDNRIHFLASNSGLKGRKRQPIITPSEEAKMLSIKWDRNIGDHPADDEAIRKMVQDSRAILELGISMIRLMKIKRESITP